MIDLRGRGMSLRRIARTLGLAWATVRRWVRAGSFPERAAGAPRHRRSGLDAYEPYLRGRWDMGCRNAAELYRELRVRGFAGSEPRVPARRVSTLRP